MKNLIILFGLLLPSVALATFEGNPVLTKNGGTQQTTYTDGQILIGNTSTGSLSKATITAGSNITITNGGGSITIAASGSGSSNLTVTSQSSTYSILTTDQVAKFDATSSAFTATLPTAVGVTGKVYWLIKTDSTFNAVTIATTSSQTINGSTTTKLSTQGENLQIVSDGSNWQVISRGIPSNTISYTPTLTGFGSTTNVNFFYKRRGDEVYVQYFFSNGTVTATLGKISLPSGLSIDTSKIYNQSTGNHTTNVGQLVCSGSATSNQANVLLAYVTTDATSIYLGKQYDNTNQLIGDNPSNQLSSNASCSGWFTVPISGWAN